MGCLVFPGPIPETLEQGIRGRGYPVDVYNTLGAGDVFHGAYCHYLARGEGAVEALELASAVAAESCRYYGTREWIAGSQA